MSKLKVESQSIFVNILVPFKIGKVLGDAVMQIIYFEKKDDTLGTEVEYVDLKRISYMGCDVSDPSKLTDFHKELGINLHKLIEDEVLETANQWAADHKPKTILL